ncbi:hypothetical protein TRVL_09003 [Trypanosoma vivax]|nr:hypothetical protein TRVL_09003 [Trypanosoma vivax]
MQRIFLLPPLSLEPSPHLPQTDFQRSKQKRVHAAERNNIVHSFGPVCQAAGWQQEFHKARARPVPFSSSNRCLPLRGSGVLANPRTSSNAAAKGVERCFAHPLDLALPHPGERQRAPKGETELSCRHPTHPRSTAHILSVSPQPHYAAVRRASPSPYQPPHSITTATTQAGNQTLTYERSHAPLSPPVVRARATQTKPRRSVLPYTRLSGLPSQVARGHSVQRLGQVLPLAVHGIVCVTRHARAHSHNTGSKCCPLFPSLNRHCGYQALRCPR